MGLVPPRVIPPPPTYEEREECKKIMYMHQRNREMTFGAKKQSSLHLSALITLCSSAFFVVLLSIYLKSVVMGLIAFFFLVLCGVVGIAPLLWNEFSSHGPTVEADLTHAFPLGRSGLYTMNEPLPPHDYGSYSPLVEPADDAFPLRYRSPSISTPPQGGDASVPVQYGYTTQEVADGLALMAHTGTTIGETTTQQDYDEPMASYPEMREDV